MDRSHDGMALGDTSCDDAGLSARDHAPSQLANVPATFIGRVGGLSLHVVSDLEAVAQSWREFQKTAWLTPFQDFDWISAWFDVAGRRRGHKPFVVLGYQDDELQLIMPLSLERAGGFDKLCWLAQSVNDYNAPLMSPQFSAGCDSARVRAIWDLVLAACGPMDLIEFGRQPDTICGQHNPFIASAAMPSSCDAHLINLRPGWKEFYAGLRGSKSRRRLREKARKLARLGKLQFRSEKDSGERQALIRQALAWKSRQLDAAGDRNPFAPDTGDVAAGSAMERTLLALCEAPGARRKLRLDGLYVDGRPIAVIIALIAGTDYSVLITAHADDETAKFSPGTTLLIRAMELACRAGYRRFDLMAGDEAYKMDWCDGQIGLFDEVRGLSAKGRSAAPVIRLIRRIKKALKQNPRAMHLFRSLNKRRSGPARR